MPRMLLRVALLIAAIVAGMAAGVVNAAATPDDESCGVSGNLVTNCGFEDGTASSWTETHAARGSGAFAVSSDFGVYGSHSGDYDYAFGATGGLPDTLAQTISGTTSGTTYTIAFYLANDDDAADNQFSAVVSNISTAPVVIADLDDSAAFGWTEYSGTFTATSSAPVLTFQSYNTADYYYVDDVSVAGPQPTLNSPGPIGFSPDSTGAFGGQQTLSASSDGASTPVVFSVDPSSGTDSGTSQPVCALDPDGSTLHYTGVGTCLVDADQAADSTYSAAVEQQATITVGKAGQRLTFAGPSSGIATGSTTLSATAGASGAPVTFSVDPSSDSGVCSLDSDGVTLRYHRAGSCVVDADEAGTSDYDAAPQVQATFPVGRAAPGTISFTPADSGQVGGSQTLSATGDGASTPVTFSLDASSDAGVCSLGTDGVTLSYDQAGSCVVDADQDADSTYSAATRTQATISVAPAVVPPPDGAGRVTLNRSHVTAGATGKQLIFTYTAATVGPSDGSLRLGVPSAWPTPSTSSTAPGYVTSTCGTVAVSGQLITVTGVTLTGGSTCTITFGSKGGGGAGLTAPASTGVQSFPAGESSSTSGTVSALASDPSLQVVAAPVLSSLSPSSGSVLGGTVVTLTGSGFRAGDTVRATVPGSRTITLTGAQVTSSSSITVTMPADPGATKQSSLAWKLRVVSFDGVASGAAPFTYQFAVTQITPTSGASGTSVTITGIGFATGDIVKLGIGTGLPTAVTVSGATVVSATSITITMPDHASGKFRLWVVTPNGLATVGTPFTYPRNKT